MLLLFRSLLWGGFRRGNAAVWLVPPRARVVTIDPHTRT